MAYVVGKKPFKVGRDEFLPPGTMLPPEIAQVASLSSLLRLGWVIEVPDSAIWLPELLALLSDEQLAGFALTKGVTVVDDRSATVAALMDKAKAKTVGPRLSDDPPISVVAKAKAAADEARAAAEAKPKKGGRAA